MPPNFSILKETPSKDFIVVAIDTAKATYQGRPWKTLGDWGKRKWENLLVLSRPKKRIKINYI